jgi:hypothetical protein
VQKVSCITILVLFSFLGVHLVRRAIFGLLYLPRMTDEFGIFGGIRIGPNASLSITDLASPIGL